MIAYFLPGHAQVKINRRETPSTIAVGKTDKESGETLVGRASVENYHVGIIGYSLTSMAK